MADAETIFEVKKAARTPPYVSFKTFLTLLDELKTNGIPPQVDRSVLARFSGGVGAQLLGALKSLDMVTDDNKPTPSGIAIINALGTDPFNELLKAAMRGAYPFLSDLNLLHATPSMFAEAFRKGTDAKEDVLRKCRTFYLHAAQQVGIQIGPRIAKGSVPRASNGGSTGRRKARVPKEKDASKTGEHKGGNPDVGGKSDTVAQTLLDKFPTFDPSWPDPIKAKWFDGYERLLSMGDKKSG
jgi:hypothetical protein